MTSVLEDRRMESRPRADGRSRRLEVEFQTLPDMQQVMSDLHKRRHEEFKAFVATNVDPFAEQWDREQRLPDSILTKLAEHGHLGCTLPVEYDGQGWDTITFGLLNEAMGRGSSALTDVLTVHAMVSMTLLKWGTIE